MEQGIKRSICRLPDVANHISERKVGCRCGYRARQRDEHLAARIHIMVGIEYRTRIGAAGHDRNDGGSKAVRSAG